MIDVLFDVAKYFVVTSVGFGMGIFFTMELFGMRVKSKTRMRLQEGVYDVTTRGRLTIEAVEE